MVTGEEEIADPTLNEGDSDAKSVNCIFRGSISVLSTAASWGS